MYAWIISSDGYRADEKETNAQRFMHELCCTKQRIYLCVMMSSLEKIVYLINVQYKYLDLNFHNSLAQL